MVVGKLETSISVPSVRMWMCVFVCLYVTVCVPMRNLCTHTCPPSVSASARLSVFSFLSECGSSAQVERRQSMSGIQRIQLLTMTSWQFKKQFPQGGGALGGLAFKKSAVLLFTDGKCVHVTVFVFKAWFPQFPRGVFSVTPGHAITHLCVLDDLICKVSCWMLVQVWINLVSKWG